MKKLMVAVALVCAAVCGQAADANWKMAATGIMNGQGASGPDYLWNGAAYIFDASKADQKTIFEAFAADVAKFDITKQTGFIKEGVVASGAINNATAANQFAYGDRSPSASEKIYQSFFFALIDGDKMYLSTDSDSLAAGGGDAAINIPMGAQAAGSMIKAAEGWQGAGKWSVAAVPEPTSGLLLLLGVAGLALKRRRA